MQKEEIFDLMVPLSIVPSPVVDIRIHDGMIMQNVLRIEEDDYVWPGKEEGWFDIGDKKGVHGAFYMCGDGRISLFLKNGEPILSFEMMKNLWDEFEASLKDGNSESHRRLLELQGYL